MRVRLAFTIEHNALLAHESSQSTATPFFHLFQIRNPSVNRFLVVHEIP